MFAAPAKQVWGGHSQKGTSRCMLHIPPSDLKAALAIGMIMSETGQLGGEQVL